MGPRLPLSSSFLPAPLFLSLLFFIPPALLPLPLPLPLSSLSFLLKKRAYLSPRPLRHSWGGVAISRLLTPPFLSGWRSVPDAQGCRVETVSPAGPGSTGLG